MARNAGRTRSAAFARWALLAVAVWTASAPNPEHLSPES